MKYFQLLRLYFAKRCSLLIFSLIAIGANAQNNTCPLNLDFEKGDLTNWQCLVGTVEGIRNGNTGTNVLHLSPSIPTSRHTLIPASNKELDQYGNFPKHCPNGSKFSLLLGDSGVGAEAEGVTYTFTIPASASQFSLTYYYAIVLKNPSHLPHEQPRFRARVIDVNSGSEINCVSFDFIASASLPGFKTSPVRNDVVYKDWTPITINLGDYAGKTIRLEFITSDCTPGRDFGYAYIDIASNCGNPLTSASLCDGDSFLTLIAPEGFQGYSWYMNNDYSTTISTQMTYKVNPIPAEATAYSLIIHPYPGFGCIDTFSAPVKWQPKPAFDAGPDRQIFCTELIQLGSTSNPGYSYSWTPADKLTNPVASNPRLKNLIFSPVNFVVTTTDNVTGCVSTDFALITPKNCFLFVPTAFTPNGDGLNDVLRPYLGGIEKFKRFSIYNRSGNLVFSTTKEGEGWDGYYKGVKLDPAVFVWMLEYISKDEQVVLEKGTVVIIR